MATTGITWQHVQQAPDDGKRREAIGGDLYVTPAPSVRHQAVSGRLERELRRILEDPDHGDVYDAPIGVAFPETGEGVQPDLLFVSRERLPGALPEGYLTVAPDLVVEVVSPSNAASAIQDKVLEYLDAGVRLVWVVDPKARTATTYRSRSRIAILDEDEELDGGDVLPGFRLPLKKVLP